MLCDLEVIMWFDFSEGIFVIDVKLKWCLL